MARHPLNVREWLEDMRVLLTAAGLLEPDDMTTDLIPLLRMFLPVD